MYVLTSSRAFSGGEDFGYTLQALGRAEVIGEATGGGAHPTPPFPISAAAHIGIPFSRSINPVTGTKLAGHRRDPRYGSAQAVPARCRGPGEAPPGTLGPFRLGNRVRVRREIAG